MRGIGHGARSCRVYLDCKPRSVATTVPTHASQSDAFLEHGPSSRRRGERVERLGTIQGDGDNHRLAHMQTAYVILQA